MPRQKVVIARRRTCPGWRRAARCALVVLGLVLWASRAHGAAPEARPRYELDVEVDVAGRALRGRARITLENTSGAPLERVLLWRYPDRLAVRSPALNDFNFYWVYPYRFNPATMTVRAARVDGQPVTVALQDHRHAGPRTLLSVPLPRALPPGGRVAIEIDYAVHLPDRYGAFGCFRKTCILGGGFYPMVPPLGAGGFELDAPPARADFAVAVTVPRPSDVIVQGVRTRVGGAGTVRAALRDTRAATLLVSAPIYRTEEVVHRGVRIRYEVAAPPPVPSPPGFVVPYWPADRVTPVLTTARRAVDLLAELGLPPPDAIRLVEGALRTEVAQALPGVVLVSDRAFDLIPLGSFLAAHELALARALFGCYAEEITSGRERAADAGWAPDLAGSLLAARYARREAHRSARDSVARVGFIQQVDRILYAPQVPFATAYFYTLADPDPLRDNLAQFNNDWPRGRTFYEKLSDLLGEPAVLRVVRRQLAGEPARAAAEAVHGAPLGWFFRQWLGPYPKVDYRFREVRRRRVGGRYRLTLVVEKRGQDPPVEPVVVQVRERGGRTLAQTWSGRGREHRYEFDLAAPPAEIRLDPRGRLEEDLPGSNEDLKFNERLPARWKVLIGKFDIAAGSSVLDADVSVLLSRVRDLKHTIGIELVRNQLNTIGLLLAYSRWFGPKVTPAQLAWHVSATVGAARLPALGDPGPENQPGTALSAAVSLGWDDRLYEWEPMRARTLNLQARYTLTALDNGALLSRGDVTGSWESILHLADGHRLALLVGAGVAFGALAAPQQLLSAGAPSGLRGFPLGDLLGRAYGLARAEYRHVFVHSLNVNLLSTYYLRGLSGALFAEAGVVSACDRYAVDRSSFAADVGYGVTLIGEWFGFAQNAIRFSVAVPVVRPERDCFGWRTPPPDRPPVIFLVNFGPPW